MHLPVQNGAAGRACRSGIAAGLCFQTQGHGSRWSHVWIGCDWGLASCQALAGAACSQLPGSLPALARISDWWPQQPALVGACPSDIILTVTCMMDGCPGISHGGPGVAARCWQWGGASLLRSLPVAECQYHSGMNIVDLPCNLGFVLGCIIAQMFRSSPGMQRKREQAGVGMFQRVLAAAAQTSLCPSEHISP